MDPLKVTMSSITIPSAQALPLDTLIAGSPHAIASRVLVKNGGGSATLFAFAAGESLAEHASPFDALAVVLEGSITITVGGVPAEAAAGTVVLMPATVPHALDATAASRMLLVMLRAPAV